MLYLLGKEINNINSQQIYKLNENGIYCSVQKLELTMHYSFRKGSFNILSSLCIYDIIHFNNHRILFFSNATNCVTNESWYCCLSKYTRQLMFYIKPLYMLTCSPKPFFFIFGLVKKKCYKYLQHLLVR